MMHKFPGIDYNSILISMKKDAELILVNTVRATLLLHKGHFSKHCRSYFPTAQINGFTYIKSEAGVPSFHSYNCSEHFLK